MFTVESRHIASPSLKGLLLPTQVVYKGICIQCNATKVPAAVLQVFVARHTCKRSSGQSPSHCVPTSIKTKNQLEAHVQSAGTLVLGGDADTCRRSSTSTFEKISVPSSQSGRSMCSAYSQAGNKCHTASSHAEEEENDLFPWEPVSIAEEDPTLWSISYDQLMSVDERIKNLFPIRNPTMRDVNSDFIAPLCKEKKKSFALQQNPGGLLVDAFISHSWYVASAAARQNSSSLSANLPFVSFAQGRAFFRFCRFHSKGVSDLGKEAKPLDLRVCACARRSKSRQGSGWYGGCVPFALSICPGSESFEEICDRSKLHE